MDCPVNVEQVVAGFINRNKDGAEFTIDDVYSYILSLWNSCGLVRLNFTKSQCIEYLNKCDGVCLRIISTGWCIDKSLLSDKMSPKERELLNNDKELAKSWDLFCRLQVDLKTDRYLLDAMGYRFIYAN